MTTTTTFLGFLATLTVALAWYVRQRARQVAEDPLGSCRCPHCGQKLRFRSQQTRRQMLCPRCVRGFTVPVEGAAGDDQRCRGEPVPFPRATADEKS